MFNDINYIKRLKLLPVNFTSTCSLEDIYIYCICAVEIRHKFGQGCYGHSLALVEVFISGYNCTHVHTQPSIELPIRNIYHHRTNRNCQELCL